MTNQDMNDKSGFRPNKNELYEFLNSQGRCVVSSLDETGQPQAAFVAFSQTKSFEFVIGTDADSRKSGNMQRDERVAMTITDADRRYTVQLEGKSRLLDKSEFDSSYADNHYAKLPGSLPFKDLPNQAFFVIKPTHLRFSDVSVYPWQLTEFSF